MDEVTKATSAENQERQLTDKELEAILKQSEGKIDFPQVTFDEFTPPTYEEWVDACNALLKGKPFDKLMYTKTYEGITFSPIYTLRTGPDAQDAILPTDDYPGMGDFIRGQKVNGYKEEPWGIAQSCDEALPKENNELLKHEIDRGSTVYNVRLDASTLHGIDVTDAEKPGETGVSLTTLEDVHNLLDGLDLAKYPFMMYTGESALAPLAMVAAAVKAQGKDVSALHGVIGGSPLTQLLTDGRNKESLEKAYDQMAETIRWARKNAPSVATVFITSDVFSLGGAQAVQEIAYTFGVAVEYVREMLKRGISIHDIAQSFYFGFNVGATFFIEIAKLRAARQVWSNIMKAFGAEEEDRSMKIHAKPAFFTKTIFDVGVNMLRNTTEAFSAVVGGVDTYENAPYDDTVRKGDEFSRRIARNLQIMLQEEFGMLRPIDAAGGSWAIEKLTKEMAEKIWAEFQKIESLGGMTKAIKEGYPQKEIKAVLEKRFKALDLRKDRAVGNNMYPLMGEVLLEARPEDTEAIKKELGDAAKAYRADLDLAFRSQKLAELKDAGEGEAIDKAAAAGATIGEINEVAGNAEGSVAIEKIDAHRWTERFEALRFDTEAYKEKTGKNVEIFLANMGKIPQHKARADFSTSFLQVGEFNVHLNNGFQDDEDKPGSRWDKCVEALKAGADDKGTPYDVAVICSTDATYPEDVPALAPRLKEVLGDGTLFLAGAAPKDLEETYRKAGVDDFISVKANCYEILRMLQKKKGMIE
jgi:methylmalonyl-CoA mutase